MRIKSNPFDLLIRKLRPGEAAYFARPHSDIETEPRALSPTLAIIKNYRSAAGWQVF